MKHIRRWVIPLVLFAAAAGAAPLPLAAQAAPPDTLTLAEAVRLAREANPGLQAARASARAAGERVGPAGSLPDPQLQFGLMNRMASQFGSTADPMTMNQIQLMQTVPWPGRLSAQRAAARHDAAAAQADADEDERTLVSRVRSAYAEVAYADRAIAVMARTRGLLRDFRTVSTSMYGVGLAAQPDVLRAQVEVARMDAALAEMRQERIASAARLNALLGRGATDSVPATELAVPDSEALPPVDTLLAWALASRPALRAGAERVAAAEASLSAARRGLLPDLSVGVAYQQRPAFPDMVSVMVGVDLPLFAAAKQLPQQRDAAASRDVNRAELTDLRNETVAQVIEARARGARARDLAALYTRDVLPQARAAVQAALASYRVGQVNFMTLVDDELTVNRYETETFRLFADYQQAVADLEALAGRPLAPEDQP